MNTITATLFSLPDGRKSIITITECDAEEADFFSTRPVSLEQLTTGEIVVYALSNAENPDDDGERIEVIYIAPQGQPCREALRHLRTETECIEMSE